VNHQQVRKIHADLRRVQETISWATKRIPQGLRFRSEGAEVEGSLCLAARILQEAAADLAELTKHLEPDLLEHADQAGPEVKVKSHKRSKPKKERADRDREDKEASENLQEFIADAELVDRLPPEVKASIRAEH